MQKLLLLATLLLLGCKRGDSVYLCNGPQSKVYHKKSDCKGLRKCSTEIEMVEIDAAKARLRRECGYCYH